MADIFDEVSEELRADRARKFFKQNLGLLIAAAILVVIGAGGWQAWQWHQARQRDAVADTFIGAMRAASGPADANTPSRNQALTEFEQLAATGPEGYRALARLRAAALKAAAGDVAGALTLWDQVSADTAADAPVRDVANYLWVQHQIDTGNPDAVQGRLAPLLAPGNLWRPLALESQALLLLRTGDADKAREILRQLASDPQALQGVRTRASGLLTRLGEAAPSPSGNTGG